MEPRLRASPEQFSALIEFMERHGDLSKPQAGPQGRIRSDQLWQEVTNLLNSLGGGVQRSSDKWKKVWADWKCKTKKKSVLFRRQVIGPGGGLNSRQTLTALEKRVMAVMGVSAVNGQPDIQEQDFNRQVDSPSPTKPIIGIYLEEADTPHSSSIQRGRVTLSNPLRQSPQPTPMSTPAPLHSPTGTAGSSGRTCRSRQSSRSPSATTSPPPRRLLRARRKRGQTPFDRAASEFVAVEQRRLDFEEARDLRLHEREMERLRLEAQRIEVTRENNQLLHQLAVIAQFVFNHIEK